jgi:hypothetical protein
MSDKMQAKIAHTRHLNKAEATGRDVENRRACESAPGQSALECQARAMEPGPGIGGNHGTAAVYERPAEPEKTTVADRLVAAVDRAFKKHESDRMSKPRDHLTKEHRKRIAEDYRRYAADLDGVKD